MTALKVSEIIGFVGPPGSGKTALAMHKYKARKNIIRVDVMHEDGMAKGALICESLAELAAAMIAGEARICFRGVTDVEGRQEAFDQVCRLAIAADETWTIFADEVETLVNRNNVPAHVSEVLERGRHHHVNLIWTSKRPAKVNPEFRSNSNTQFVFKSMESTYRNFYKGIAAEGFDEALMNLPNYGFIELMRDGNFKKKQPAKIS